MGKSKISVIIAREFSVRVKKKSFIEIVTENTPIKNNNNVIATIVFFIVIHPF